MTVTRQTTDKPWVTDQFRHLIHCRQYALKNGHTVRYKAYVKDVEAEVLRQEDGGSARQQPTQLVA